MVGLYMWSMSFIISKVLLPRCPRLLLFLLVNASCSSFRFAMAMKNTAALGSALLNFYQIVLDLGNNYFRANAAWERFPTRVRMLQDTHEDLTKKLEEYGLSQKSLEFLHETVEEAKKLLDWEISKLEKRKSRKNRAIICGVLFRESVEAYIAAMEGAFCDISTHLEKKLQNDGLLRDTALREPGSLPYATDKCKRYVRLETMEKKVCDAIEGAGQDPAVLLLSGEPGNGKSTLAREVSLHCTVGNSTITRVVMVECGPRVDVAAKKIELLRTLGGEWTPQPPDDARAAKSSPDKALQVHLRNPRLLIFLDDLWECELIDNLVNLSGPGPGAKYLVTSRSGNLCEETNCKKTVLRIEYLSKSVAMKIAASHAKLDDQKIPPHLQEAAEQVIEQADSNPLVLATLGAYIAATRNEKCDVQL